MIVSIQRWNPEDHDYREYFKVTVDGKRQVRFLDGEPEDANLSRDFSDVFAIPSLMKDAYEAGKRGEEFKIVEEEDLEW